MQSSVNQPRNGLDAGKVFKELYKTIFILQHTDKSPRPQGRELHRQLCFYHIPKKKCDKIDAAGRPTISWNRAAKTGSFTQDRREGHAETRQLPDRRHPSLPLAAEPLAALLAQAHCGIIGVKVHDRPLLPVASSIGRLASRQRVAALEDVVLELVELFEGADLDLLGVLDWSGEGGGWSVCCVLRVEEGDVCGVCGVGNSCFCPLLATRAAHNDPSDPQDTNKATLLHRPPRRRCACFYLYRLDAHAATQPTPQEKGNTPPPTLSPLRRTTTMSPHAPKPRDAVRTSATSW